MTSNFIFQLNTCGYSPYVTCSLTRGWVCRLQLLLSSPAQSYSGPSPAGLITIFYCLWLETPPTWRTRSLYLHPPGTGWSGYTPRHCSKRSAVSLINLQNAQKTPLFLLLSRRVSTQLASKESRRGPHRKKLSYIVGRVCVFWKCLPSNGVFWLHSLILWANPLHYISTILHGVISFFESLSFSLNFFMFWPLRVPLYIEDWERSFLRNIGKYSPDCTASHSGRQ
jgi:hypothetical protein